jgi:hypothetical protein
VTPGELRARLRPHATNERDRFCGIRACATEASPRPPAVVLKQSAEGTRASWQGIMLCGHIWTCPVCSRVLRAKRAVRVESAVKGLGGEWILVTVTYRHRNAAGQPLKASLDALMRAWRRTRQGGRYGVQGIWERKVSASVRATEVTTGMPHGWHPHVHVLIRSEAWTREERDKLFDAWSRAIVAELGEDARPTSRRGLDMTPPFSADAAPSLYLVKMGLEVAGVAKEGGRGRWTPAQIAEHAVAGDPRAALLWKEYACATRGHQAVRLDSRAQEAALSFIEGSKLSERVSGDDTGPSQPSREVELRALDVNALHRMRIGEVHHPQFLEAMLADAETSADPEAALRDWLRFASPARELVTEHEVRARVRIALAERVRVREEEARARVYVPEPPPARRRFEATDDWVEGRYDGARVRKRRVASGA